MIQLKETLAKRCDGYWELLATSVGECESVTKTLRALSKEELAKEVDHRDWIVAERVEALAAWNPRLLVEVAATWPTSHHGSFLLWFEAWRASLRHLKARNVIRPEEIVSPELAEEVDILWGELPGESVSWSGLLTALKRKPTLDVNLVRKLSRLPLATPYPSLEEVLEAPTAMLRLLRGRVPSLSVELQDFLLSAARSCLEGELRRVPALARKWSIGADGEAVLVTDPSQLPYLPLGRTPLQGNLSDAPIFLELCREISQKDLGVISERLASRIPTIANPREIAMITYVLTTEWSLP